MVQTLVKPGWPLWVWAIACTVLLSMAAVFVIVQLRDLRRYLARIGNAIAAARLIERLAVGFRDLPDIHRCTALSWKLFLGGPPRDLVGQVKLLASNLDWYLLSEPRPCIRVLWVLYLLTVIPLRPSPSRVGGRSAVPRDAGAIREAIG